MPENFRRPKVHPGGANVPSPSQCLDLTNLTEQEEKIIQNVLRKDELERNVVDAKINEVRKEIQELRKAGALTGGDNQDTICARCKFKFPSLVFPLGDHGQRCATCKFRVCRKCSTREPSGMWLCILCLKYRQEKWLTGEWMSKGQSFGLQGSDLLRVSLRNRTIAPQLSRSSSSDPEWVKEKPGYHRVCANKSVEEIKKINSRFFDIFFKD